MTEEKKKNPANLVRACRTAMGISQEMAARRSKIGLQQFQKIENGLADPKLSTCLRMAKGLEATLSEIFDPPKDVKKSKRKK